MAVANVEVRQDGDVNFRVRSPRCQKMLDDDPRLEPMVCERTKLAESLDPTTLLDHMGLLLSSETREKIAATIQNIGEIAAARQFIDALLATGHHQLFGMFIDILREAGHEIALEIMQGTVNTENKRKRDVFKRTIQLLRSEIVKHMVVDVALLNELVGNQCISEKTKRMIESKCGQNGYEAAASALLDRVSRLLPDWPHRFVRALITTGNESVVEILSADFLRPGNSIEDVLEDMAIVNPLPEPLFIPVQGEEPQDSGQSPGLINQTANVEGSGNVSNIVLGDDSQLTINNTVFNQFPTVSASHETDESRSMQKLHNCLGLALSNTIRDDQLKALKHYYSNWLLRAGELTKEHDFLDLWKILLERGEISPRAYKGLEDALTNIKTGQCLLDVILDYKQRMESEAGVYKRWIRDDGLIKTEHQLMGLIQAYRRVWEEHGRSGTVFKNAVLGHIKPEGGNLRLINGSATLEIPAGAVKEPTIFWIFCAPAGTELLVAPESEEASEILPESDNIVKYSLPVCLGPPDVPFRKPIKLSLKEFSNPDFDYDRHLSVYRKKRDNCAWEYVGSCTTDSNSRIASFELNSFSSYVLGMPVTDALFLLNVHVIVQKVCNEDDDLRVYFILNDYSYVEQFIKSRRINVDRATCLFLDPQSEVTVSWVKRPKQCGQVAQFKQVVLQSQVIQNLAETPTVFKLTQPSVSKTDGVQDVMQLEQNGEMLMELEFNISQQNVIADVEHEWPWKQSTEETKKATKLQSKGKMMEGMTGPRLSENSASLMSVKPEKAEVVLRDFQKKLAQPALEGKNTIICAPTGSGKPIIAAHIMKVHLEKNPGKNKAIFLTDVASANQLYRVISMFLGPEFRTAHFAETDEVDVKLSELMLHYDFIVLSATCMQNAMSKKWVSFDDFSMIVLDECQYTYDTIMERYIDEKLNGNKALPQVLGLTASFGSGKATNMSKAIEHVLKMCAYLDTAVLSIPVLEGNWSRKLKTTMVTPSREFDPFHDSVSEMMTEIEKKLKQICEGKDKVFQLDVGSVTSAKGSHAYLSWITKIKTPLESSATLSSTDRLHALTYLEYLKTYSRALEINHICRTKDALEYIREELKNKEHVPAKYGSDVGDWGTEKKGKKDEERAWLEKQFQDLEKKLIEFNEDPHIRNPLLMKLKETILKQSDFHRNRAGIIFVNTREEITAICRWIKEDDDLKHLKPRSIQPAVCMTKAKRRNNLMYFGSGNFEILVATPIEEEGLDITKCAWVIRYSLVLKEIAMVQAKGRARSADSSYHVITGVGKAQKENLNRIREKMMMMALEAVKKMPKEEYESHVLSYQKRCAEARKKINMEPVKKADIGNQKGPYLVHCRRCQIFLCQADDLRVLGQTHRTVIGDFFRNKYSMWRGHRSRRFSDMEFIGKINCQNCAQDLGVFAHYSNIAFPLLKVSCLVFVGPAMTRCLYSKWKNVPFMIKNITADEIMAASVSVLGKTEGADLINKGDRQDTAENLWLNQWRDVKSITDYELSVSLSTPKIEDDAEDLSDTASCSSGYGSTDAFDEETDYGVFTLD